MTKLITSIIALAIVLSVFLAVFFALIGDKVTAIELFTITAVLQLWSLIRVVAAIAKAIIGATK